MQHKSEINKNQQQIEKTSKNKLLDGSNKNILQVLEKDISLYKELQKGEIHMSRNNDIRKEIYYKESCIDFNNNCLISKDTNAIGMDLMKTNICDEDVSESILSSGKLIELKRYKNMGEILNQNSDIFCNHLDFDKIDYNLLSSIPVDFNNLNCNISDSKISQKFKNGNQLNNQINCLVYESKVKACSFEDSINKFSIDENDFTLLRDHENDTVYKHLDNKTPYLCQRIKNKTVPSIKYNSFYFNEKSNLLNWIDFDKEIISDRNKSNEEVLKEEIRNNKLRNSNFRNREMSEKRKFINLLSKDMIMVKKMKNIDNMKIQYDDTIKYKNTDDLKKKECPIMPRFKIDLIQNNIANEINNIDNNNHKFVEKRENFDQNSFKYEENNKIVCINNNNMIENAIDNNDMILNSLSNEKSNLKKTTACILECTVKNNISSMEIDFRKYQTQKYSSNPNCIRSVNDIYKDNSSDTYRSPDSDNESKEKKIFYKSHINQNQFFETFEIENDFKKKSKLQMNILRSVTLKEDKINISNHENTIRIYDDNLQSNIAKIDDVFKKSFFPNKYNQNITINTKNSTVNEKPYLSLQEIVNVCPGKRENKTKQEGLEKNKKCILNSTNKTNTNSIENDIFNCNSSNSKINYNLDYKSDFANIDSINKTHHAINEKDDIFFCSSDESTKKYSADIVNNIYPFLDEKYNFDDIYSTEMINSKEIYIERITCSKDQDIANEYKDKKFRLGTDNEKNIMSNISHNDEKMLELLSETYSRQNFIDINTYESIPYIHKQNSNLIELNPNDKFETTQNTTISKLEVFDSIQNVYNHSSLKYNDDDDKNTVNERFNEELRSEKIPVNNIKSLKNPEIEDQTNISTDSNILYIKTNDIRDNVSEELNQDPNIKSDMHSVVNSEHKHKVYDASYDENLHQNHFYTLEKTNEDITFERQKMDNCIHNVGDICSKIIYLKDNLENNNYVETINEDIFYQNKMTISQKNVAIIGDKAAHTKTELKDIKILQNKSGKCLIANNDSFYKGILIEKQNKKKLYTDKTIFKRDEESNIKYENFGNVNQTFKIKSIANIKSNKISLKNNDYNKNTDYNSEKRLRNIYAHRIKNINKPNIKENISYKDKVEQTKFENVYKIGESVDYIQSETESNKDIHNANKIIFETEHNNFILKSYEKNDPSKHSHQNTCSLLTSINYSQSYNLNSLYNTKVESQQNDIFCGATDHEKFTPMENYNISEDIDNKKWNLGCFKSDSISINNDECIMENNIEKINAVTVRNKQKFIHNNIEKIKINKDKTFCMLNDVSNENNIKITTKNSYIDKNINTENIEIKPKNKGAQLLLENESKNSKLLEINENKSFTDYKKDVDVIENNAFDIPKSKEKMNENKHNTNLDDIMIDNEKSNMFGKDNLNSANQSQTTSKKEKTDFFDSILNFLGYDENSKKDLHKEKSLKNSKDQIIEKVVNDKTVEEKSLNSASNNKLEYSTKKEEKVFQDANITTEVPLQNKNSVLKRTRKSRKMKQDLLDDSCDLDAFEKEILDDLDASEKNKKEMTMKKELITNGQNMATKIKMKNMQSTAMEFLTRKSKKKEEKNILNDYNTNKNNCIIENNLMNYNEAINTAKIYGNDVNHDNLQSSNQTYNSYNFNDNKTKINFINDKSPDLYNDYFQIVTKPSSFNNSRNTQINIMNQNKNNRNEHQNQHFQNFKKSQNNLFYQNIINGGKNYENSNYAKTNLFDHNKMNICENTYRNHNNRNIKAENLYHKYENQYIDPEIIKSYQKRENILIENSKRNEKNKKSDLQRNFSSYRDYQNNDHFDSRKVNLNLKSFDHSDKRKTNNFCTNAKQQHYNPNIENFEYNNNQYFNIMNNKPKITNNNLNQGIAKIQNDMKLKRTSDQIYKNNYVDKITASNDKNGNYSGHFKIKKCNIWDPRLNSYKSLNLDYDDYNIRLNGSQIFNYNGNENDQKVKMNNTGRFFYNERSQNQENYSNKNNQQKLSNNNEIVNDHNNSINRYKNTLLRNDVSKPQTLDYFEQDSYILYGEKKHDLRINEGVSHSTNANNNLYTSESRKNTMIAENYDFETKNYHLNQIKTTNNNSYISQFINCARSESQPRINMPQNNYNVNHQQYNNNSFPNLHEYNKTTQQNDSINSRCNTKKNLQFLDIKDEDIIKSNLYDKEGIRFLNERKYIRDQSQKYSPNANYNNADNFIDSFDNVNYENRSVKNDYNQNICEVSSQITTKNQPKHIFNDYLNNKDNGLNRKDFFINSSQANGNNNIKLDLNNISDQYCYNSIEKTKNVDFGKLEHNENQNLNYSYFNDLRTKPNLCTIDFNNNNNYDYQNIDYVQNQHIKHNLNQDFVSYNIKPYAYDQSYNRKQDYMEERVKKNEQFYPNENYRHDSMNN